MRGKQPHTLVGKMTYFLSLILTATCLIFTPSQAHANPKYASIVIDADTGQIISARHADKILHPASLTKIMTLLLTFEALEDGRLTLKSRVPISRHAASMVPSKIGLSPGSSISVKDAILALVTKSANDVAVALGEAIGGTESQFAYRMTQKAREIGMRNTRFKNASGLHHPSQISTARDMAKLARYVIRAYPNYYGYFATSSFRYRGHTYSNHNRLMRTYKGMDGLKTGYINASGFNLVSSAVRDNRRLIGVVFGGRTSRSRNAHMEALLNAGFGKIRTVRIANHKPAPTPTPKPSPEVMLAALTPQASMALLGTVRDITSIIGQGDTDPEISKRYETGLLAATLHTKQDRSMDGIGVFDYDALTAEKAFYGANSLNTAPLTTGWSVQVGAFNSRLASDRAIQTAQAKLPVSHLRGISPRIVPGKTKDQRTVFRARLSGYSEQAARETCQMIENCIVISPN